MQRWFTQRGGRVKSTIEIDLKFIKAGGWSQKRKGLLTVIVILTPRGMLYKGAHKILPSRFSVKGIVTMTKTVMVN